MLKAYKYCSGQRDRQKQTHVSGCDGVTVGRRKCDGRWTHLLLGRVVDGCQGDEAADVLSIFLENKMIPEDGNTSTVLLPHTVKHRGHQEG